MTTITQVPDQVPDAVNQVDQVPDQTKNHNLKYKCSMCIYDAYNKQNVEKHIEKTKKCAEAHIIEVEIKCNFCNKGLSSEISKANHEKICKVKKLDDELEGLNFEEQNKVLRNKFNDQNKHIELIEKQLRLLKFRFAREEEVNNIAMQNEHGLNAQELRDYCIYTLKRLFEDLTLPAVTTYFDLMKLQNVKRKPRPDKDKTKIGKTDKADDKSDKSDDDKSDN